MTIETDRPARLGIVHLLLWTAGCGVMLAGQRLLTLDEASERTSGLIEWSAQIAAAMIEGAALAGLATGVVERIRGRMFPVQPGEWLLIACGTGVALDLAAKLVIRLAMPHSDMWIASTLAFLPAAVVSIGIYTLAFQKSWSRVEWAPLFSTAAFAEACLLVGIVSIPLGGSTSFYASPVVGIMAFMGVGYVVYIYPNAIFYDLLHRTAYGPLHWVGVIVLPLHTAVYYLGMAMWLS